MKKQKYVLIDGRPFDIVGDSSFGIWHDYRNRKECNNLLEIYARYKKPSARKVAVWRDWCKWAERNHAYIRVRSANCQIFTIDGIIADENDKPIALILMTGYHNRIIYL